MNENIVIPKNDVFFYGISLRSREIADIKNNIFSNILMKYLTTLKPVFGRLYRTSDNSKYEYNYTFVPSKPLSWRVIKNRSVIEDIERLSDGKYCLNYYDDNGNDVKRVIFSNHHRWIKTNYYNTIYGENLICSLIPKELNAETVILQYNTGEPYPITLRPCPTASNPEILRKVLERAPMPEAEALTNYGLLYFACEETLNIFSQIMKEEEEKYKEAHKPPVFTTDEDIAGGFCFDVESFDTTKTLESRFDFSEVSELTDENIEFNAISESSDVDVSDNNDISEDSEVPEIINEEPASDESNPYSIDDEIANAIKMISDATNIQIDKEFVLNESVDDVNVGSQLVLNEEPTDTDDIDSTIVMISHEPISQIEDEEEFSDISEIVDTNVISQTDDVEVDTAYNETIVLFNEPQMSKSEETPADVDTVDLLTMDDDAIDDYVSTLIDSLLQDAHSTVNEYNLDKDDAFAAGSLELDSIDNTLQSNTLSDIVSEDSADSVIESNGADYFYYGDVDEAGGRTGRGRTLMSDGKLAYDGEYLNDMRHGKGSFYYKDGSLCFYGDWKENMRNGFGIGISSETGIIHTGNWKDNKPDGIGVRFDKDGNFMYLDSASERTNGGIRVVGFGKNSIIVEVWNEKTLKVQKREISLDELIN